MDVPEDGLDDIHGLGTNERGLPLRSLGQKHRSKVMAKKNVKAKTVSYPDLSSSEHNSESDELKTPREINAYDPAKWTEAEMNTEDPPICVLCDDGGQLIYCEGPCHRHFHPCEGSGAESFCQTLGLTKAEMQGKFYCQNCVRQQQQCFICGELGFTTGAYDTSKQVRRCEVPGCNRFYHVDCVAKTVAPRRDQRVFTREFLQGRRMFHCPRHCCSVCGEQELGEPGYLVQCRRCPRGWHRECLVDFARSKELEDTPIWSQHQRQYIYCRRHSIVPHLQTPKRNHVRFPDWSYS